MKWIKRVLFRRKLDLDLAEEIRQHLAEREDELVRAGLSSEEARFAARRDFGNVSLIEEEGRNVWRFAAIEHLLSDMGYAARQLRRSPSFTAAAALTLALGIGANTAVFNLISAVLLRPLPFPDSGRLVSVQSRDTRGAPHPTELSYPTFFDFRKNNTVFDHIVSYRDDEFTLSGNGLPIHLSGAIVSWDLFAVLQVQPEVGRGFLPHEEQKGEQVVILSHDLWKEQFGGDPAIAGKTISIDRQPHTVVGVAPASFNFPIRGRKVQIWTTLARDASSATLQPVTEQRGARMLGSIARLKPTVSLAAAQAQMDTIAASIARHYNNNSIASTYVRPELDRLVGDLRRPLFILSGAVALVLLIACANIANLLLVRTAERGREFALRMAIGAGRGRVIRQLLSENLFLALLASAVGALIATMAIYLAQPFIGNSLPRMGEVRIDRGVLGFSVMLALLTTLLFSIPSALQLFSADLGGSLKEGARGATGASDRLRGALVVVQIAVGLILVSGAGLLTAGFSRLMSRDLGFRPDHLLAFNIGLADTEYPSRKQVDFNARLQERLGALPGVVSTAAGMPLPLAGNEMTISFNIQERPSAPSERPSSNMAIITPSYFRTIGTPLLRGREFTEGDDETSASVLIVNEAFARKFFPGQDAVGKRIEPGATSRVKGTPMREIIGVVGNAKQSPLSLDPEPIYYFPYKQLPWSPPSILLRTSIPPAALESAVRQQVASFDKQVPVYELRTMDDMLSAGVARPRFLMLLIGCFAAIALLLTAVGLYGVIAYSVLRRTQEIGIRLALGASRGMILAMILRRAMILALVGVPIGVAGAYAEENLLQSALYGLGPHNPLLLIAACLVVALTALIAAYLPARRAASTDPMVALRSE